ncbi:putative GTP-binding protein 6 [Mercenaria mercenaria]|uniref:putative GTP-binding protein 6 n=1 Tax=Mercenaria mercenaria TaxID=6596 RepID=UPI00234FB1F2|nr:putative GTP-binding protein 6 [Mercenaria mercenaria]
MNKLPLLKQNYLRSWIYKTFNKNIKSHFISQNKHESVIKVFASHGIAHRKRYDYVQTSEKLTDNESQKISFKGTTGRVERSDCNGLLKRTVCINCLAQQTGDVAFRNPVRYYCSEIEKDNTIVGVDEENHREEDDGENIAEADSLLKDNVYNECVKQYCSLPDAGHRVFILQLVMTGSLRKQNTSAPHLQLAENEALVHSIPRWTVVNSETVKVKEQQSIRMMTKAFETVTEKIRSTPGISAVFISRNILSAEQRVLAQRLWHLPVFDRSFIVTQVFKAQAQTREAKLHLALAELPFLRFCMAHGFQPGEYGRQVKRYRRYPFEEREKKLKAALASLKKQRTLIRSRRSGQQIPTIAVIGYTNCGKTSLIKALTGDEDMIPRNKLFATLDVTAHGGLLPNNMMVIYMDTVGFLTDLPGSLKEAFTATLEDTLHSDLILHVRDASHPDLEAQSFNVTQSIQKLVPKHKLSSMIEVNNKVDRIDQSERESIMGSVPDPDVFCISAVTGEGMDDLRQEVQKRLLKNIHFLQKKIKIPLQGPHLRWLYKEATVVSTETDSDPESLIVNVYISQGNYQKFLANFGPRKTAGIRR